MKKIIGFIAIASLMLVFACSKQKLYTKDITGTWTVYKYLFKNVDETSQWIAANPYYNITFTSDGRFIERNNATVRDTVINGTVYADTAYGSIKTGTYAFANRYVNLILTDTTYVLQDTVLVPALTNRTYTIFDLSGSNVQLDTDTTQLYMSKKM